MPPRRASDANLGRSMRGLITYLLGPGRSDEHTNQRVIAGSEPLEFEYGDIAFGEDVFAPAEAANLVHELNAPMQAKRARGELPEDRGFVFHAVLSMQPGAVLDDATWNQIAHDYIEAMGFDDAAGTKVPCRWVAVHHGPSAGGNDHLHLAVQMIRDDGTWASNANSYRRSAAARRMIEEKYQLGHAEDLAQRRDHVPYPRHDASQEVHGAQVPAPAHERLRERMLAAASAAADEADYVRRLWGSRVLTRPRYADGRRSVVTGYSVALIEADGTRSTWRGAGQVHPSLRLPRLRERWEATPDSAARAARMWRAEKGAGAAVPRDPKVQRPAAAAVRELEQARAALGDETGGEGVSGLVAGVYAALAHRHERGKGGPLHEAAEAFARADSQLPARLRYPPPTLTTPLGRSVRLIAQAQSDQDVVAWMALAEQLSHLATAVADRNAARADLRETEYLRGAVSAAREVVPKVGRAAPAPRTGPEQASSGSRRRRTGQVGERPAHLRRENGPDQSRGR